MTTHVVVAISLMLALIASMMMAFAAAVVASGAVTVENMNKKSLKI